MEITEGMTAYEAGLVREIQMLRTENMDLEIKALVQLKELNDLRKTLDKIRGITEVLRELDRNQCALNRVYKERAEIAA